MKSHIQFLIISTCCILSCKSTEKEKEESFISTVSIIKGQVNHIDTSLYQITMYKTADGNTDTTYLRREEVRGIAKNFLDLPDISGKELNKKYTHESIIDEGQNALTITSTATDSLLDIQKQIIIVGLEDLASGNVKSIYFERVISNKDSVMEQKLYWEIDRFFRIANIIQKKNEHEKISLVRVVWE